MINYIIQVMLFQVLFLAVYDFFLQKETFFKLNRIYLLLTPILSFIIPLLKFESIQKSVPQEYIVQLPTILLNPQHVIEQASSNGNSINYLSIIFYLGVGLFTILFSIRLIKIIRLISVNEVIKNQDFNLVILKDKQSAFSFLKYIFLNKHLIENVHLDIIQHELVHCKQHHTLDLLAFEFMKIIMWFNPLIYVYQKRISLLHEYISDAEVIKTTNSKTYFDKLLSEVFSVENISFINQFFKQSLIKKRIAMITKNKSHKLKQLKYLLIVPLLFGMLIYSSCEFEKEQGLESNRNELRKISLFSGKENEEMISGKEGYLDLYILGAIPKGKEISFEDLTEEEKLEYESMTSKFIVTKEFRTYKFYESNEGKRAVLRIIDFERLKLSRKENKQNYEEGDDIPFAVLEEMPIYPGCEGTKEELKECLQMKINEFVSTNFDSDLANNLELSSGIHKIFVMFKIDKDGNIIDVKARAPHKDLQEEAIRVVKLLPQMTAGKHNGKAVNITYALPIAFKVQ